MRPREPSRAPTQGSKLVVELGERTLTSYEEAGPLAGLPAVQADGASVVGGPERKKLSAMPASAD